MQLWSAESLNLTFGQDVTTNPIKSRLRSEHYDLIASRLLGVYVSLHEVPHVRIAVGNARCRHIYELFAQKLTAFVQENRVVVPQLTTWAQQHRQESDIAHY